MSSWVSIVAPAGTPPAVIKVLNAELNAALTDPAFTKTPSNNGFTPAAPGEPGILAARIRAEKRMWSKVLGDAGVAEKK